jgi:methionyl-tRNA formyltransferase
MVRGEEDNVNSSGALRLGFAGTPAFAATIVQALIDNGYPPVIVYTKPDRPFGRGRKAAPSPVKVCAERAAIEICQPSSLRGVSLARHQLDAMVVAAYGLIVPPAMLTEPRHGCLNVHASLLPRWRGAAPVERAIIAGDEKSGVSIMQMAEGIDTGPVYLRRTLTIEPHWTGAALDRALAQLGADALLECLATLGSRDPVAQDETNASYAPKLTAADARVDWQCPAAAIARRIRALTERRPVTTTLADTRVRLLAAQVAATPADVAATPADVAAGTAGVTEAAGADSPPGTIVRLAKTYIGIATVDGTLNVQRLQLDRGSGRPLGARDAVNGYPQLFRVGARFDAITG